MHKNILKQFVFLDQYNSSIFKNNKSNLGVIYRNYHSKKRETELIKIAEACKKKRFKLFVSNDIKLALKVKAEGIYIPSFNRTERFNNLSKTNLKIIGSAHNQKEIKEKIKQKCTHLFLSPIFFVNKRNNFLGIYKFNSLARVNKVTFYALGGINENNINKLKLINIKGFGGISIFKKKPAYKRPVL
tara:strand:- start:1093 stop:1653 length:561 start_codon:yes stop_codon:yes gene_type:complete